VWSPHDADADADETDKALETLRRVFAQVHPQHHVSEEALYMSYHKYGADLCATIAGIVRDKVSVCRPTMGTRASATRAVHHRAWC